MSLQVPAELYWETLAWLGKRMSSLDVPPAADVPVPAVPGPRSESDDVAAYRELLDKPHEATRRVRAFVVAALADDSSRWWSSVSLQEVCGIDHHQFRSTWRALTQHMNRFYPDLPQPFERASARDHGGGDTTVYRLRPELVPILRVAVA